VAGGTGEIGNRRPVMKSSAALPGFFVISSAEAYNFTSIFWIVEF
jgi:hypothetical protein